MLGKGTLIAVNGHVPPYEGNARSVDDGRMLAEKLSSLPVVAVFHQQVKGITTVPFALAVNRDVLQVGNGCRNKSGKSRTG